MNGVVNANVRHLGKSNSTSMCAIVQHSTSNTEEIHRCTIDTSTINRRNIPTRRMRAKEAVSE